MKKHTVGSFSLIKRMNTNLIINTIRDKGFVSRTEIAKITGLTPATVTNITAQLIEQRLICEARRGLSSGGRKPVLLHLNENAHSIVGIYIGSTHIEIILSNLGAKIIKRELLPIDSSRDPYDILNDAANIVLDIVDPKTPVMGVGIGVHGIVDPEKGVSIFAPNLGWHDVKIKGFFEGKLPVPVFVDNDVRLMSLGENQFGIARRESNFVFLYIGFGIGGSIVIDDAIYKGSAYASGEIGHTTIIPDGPLCSCGNRGCLEGLASEAAMLNCIRDSLPPDGDIEYIIKNKNEEPFRSLLQDEARYLGIGIANLINTLNPSLVVINGRITQLGGEFMEAIQETVRERSMIYREYKTRILYSGMGRDAALLGSVALVLKEVFENISDHM